MFLNPDRKFSGNLNLLSLSFDRVFSRCNIVLLTCDQTLSSSDQVFSSPESRLFRTLASSDRVFSSPESRLFRTVSSPVRVFTSPEKRLSRTLSSSDRVFSSPESRLFGRCPVLIEFFQSQIRGFFEALLDWFALLIANLLECFQFLV